MELVPKRKSECKAQTDNNINSKRHKFRSPLVQNALDIEKQLPDNLISADNESTNSQEGSNFDSIVKKKSTETVIPSVFPTPPKSELSQSEWHIETEQSKNLDRELFVWRKKLEQAYRASDIVWNDEIEELENKTKEWMNAGRMAANYHWNTAGIKISRKGGLKKYMDKIRERKLKILKEEYEQIEQEDVDDMDDDVDLEAMTPEEREYFEDMKMEYKDAQKVKLEEIKKVIEREEIKDENCPLELDMKYLFILLEMDPKVLYPEGFQE